MAKTIWTLIEIEDGQPARSSLEVLGKAAKLGRAEAIVLGAQAAEVAPTAGRIWRGESLRSRRPGLRYLFDAASGGYDQRAARSP